MHFDIKPENVGVTGSGKVKLLDAGLSYSKAALGELRADWSGGTDGFTAPEMEHRSRDVPIGAHCDVYSAGMTLEDEVGYTQHHRSLTLSHLRHCEPMNSWRMQTSLRQPPFTLWWARWSPTTGLLAQALHRRLGALKRWSPRS